MRYSTFLFPLLLLASCKEQTTNPDGPPATAKETIEVLKHSQGQFTLERKVPVDALGDSFNVDTVTFTIKHRWPHAETTRAVTDDGHQTKHAIEIGWNEDDSRWVFESESDDTASDIEDLDAIVRLTPPGARPPKADDDTFPAQVQFRYQGLLLDLPEIGGEVFEGWTLKSIKTYQHALMDEEYNVTEAEDAGFVNRVLQVHITDGKGTEERHLAFLDHPNLTRGIHPEILPVARLSGDSASQSRLVVCTPVPPATEKHVVQISPDADGSGLTARIWLTGEPSYKTVAITQLPADLPLGDDGTLRVARHFTKAHSEIKWERRDVPQSGDAKPALVIEHQASHHHREAFVLIDGEVTPCRIGPKHLMLRYNQDGKAPVAVTPPAAASGKTPGNAPAPPASAIPTPIWVPRFNQSRRWIFLFMPLF